MDPPGTYKDSRSANAITSKSPKSAICSELGMDWLLNTRNPYEIDYAAIEKAQQDSINFFQSNYRFKQGKYVGSGAFGSTFIFNEEDEDGTLLRKVIVKLSEGEDADYTIDNEVECLERVRGAEHIVRLISDMGRNTGERGRRAFVMEYIEHGTWDTITSRLRLANRLIPNRMLWSVFLCLARATAGMAWPQRGSEDSANRRETAVSGEEPTTLVHSDMNLGNVMVDVWNQTDPEHRLCPITKLIDFGNALYVKAAEDEGEDPVFVGVHTNLSSISQVMIQLAINGEVWTTGVCHIPGPPGQPPTYFRASTHPNLHGRGLSRELVNLIHRCGAEEDDSLKPGLAELIAICENAVLNETAADYGHLDPADAQAETDAAIEAIVQRFILNADIALPAAAAADDIDMEDPGEGPAGDDDDGGGWGPTGQSWDADGNSWNPADDGGNWEDIIDGMNDNYGGAMPDNNQ